ncbi:mannose-6-phosphate isomerase [Hygrophoropsis aurantiaca]|uniref:Mannose-6-phosphate isomerase n=1 Tax=Hygrophoropsis aurantiaca TaxID=72124 RepID=A0ACB8APT4_9AGAM|nr:mannose-6-phosphate isomerase [Hygrophoropsis aurantiaca]
MASVDPVFHITPTTQNYDWGKIGNDSKVAQFASGAAIPGFTLKESAPYAELWMGTHPKSPSGVSGLSESLPEYLAAHPQLIGDSIPKKFNTSNGNLPFLFKVLAIGKALSIQTHPDKKTAEELHAAHPTVYTDPNHKPEMALALTPFKALCGFRPLPQIKTYLQSVPELKALIPTADKFLELHPSATSAEQKVALKDLFAALMTAEVPKINEELSKLISRYQSNGATDAEKDVKDLVLTLNEQFPNDIGVFCAYILNYVIMEPGEAIFLGAGEPHAYVSGDIMECMANSDNVIRAGLTPKPKDIQNLVSGLTYIAAHPVNHMVKPTKFGQSTLSYDPPIPDFTVLEVKVGKGNVASHKEIDGPSIAIAVQGTGSVSWQNGQKSLELSTGNVIFLGARVAVDFKGGSEGEFVVYRAYVE